jgi:hypothetical protein
MSMTGVLRAFSDDRFLSVDLDEQEFESLPSFVTAIDVDKMWHALSAITTPSAEPLRSLEDPHPLDPLVGGTEFGEDLGYGPARRLSPDQVRAVHAHLASLSDEQARARFDPDAFTAAGIYPDVWDEGPQLWDEDLLPNLTAVRTFYATAAAGGHHVVLTLE